MGLLALKALKLLHVCNQGKCRADVERQLSMLARLAPNSSFLSASACEELWLYSGNRSGAAVWLLSCLLLNGLWDANVACQSMAQQAKHPSFSSLREAAARS